MSDSTDGASYEGNGTVNITSKALDHVTDVFAIVGMVAVAHIGPSEATLQILAAAITSIALGKRYMGK